MLRLTEKALRRARARAQLLSGGASRPAMDVAGFVRAVGGIQAQDPVGAALSIRARGGASSIDEVTAALAGRSIVLTWTLRGTRHLHHREDVGWMIGLLGPAFSQPGRRAEQLGIAGETGDRAVRALCDALVDGPMTREEVKERLAPLGVDPSGQAAIHVIHRAAMEGVLCVVPGEDGGPERYALLDDWLGDAPHATDDPLTELARRHLAAFGPATPADLAVWSGLGLPRAREAWKALEPELLEVEGPAGTAWVLGNDAAEEARAAARRPAPLRLLGAFDTLLLGYADRSALVPGKHAKRVNAGGGMVKPTVLSDGRVVATWAYRRKRQATEVEVAPFRPLDAAEVAGIEREARAVGRFLGGDAVATIVER